MKYTTLILLSFLYLGSAAAQVFSVNRASQHTTGKVSQDSVRILAVMVQFQPDEDETTVGTGQFDSLFTQNYGTDIIDPLPHNKAYFDAHLEFAKNYYGKVSDGKMNIRYDVLPDIITVSGKMKDYSPEVNSTDYKPLGDLTQEVWQLADQQNPGFPFADYDLYAIFHAGVSRSVSLPGSFGNERDLPSIYINLNSLKSYYGDTYQGIPVSGGHLIQNTMILPETENRELESFGTTYLFEISMNGLVVSSIASYLGLPDLFNTETGLSAIGRFGLMDGQSIFAFHGVFPPEPSAWEKIRLGWVEPKLIEPSAGAFQFLVAAHLAPEPKENEIFKIPINESEYYLIENRQRDVKNDGSIVTIWQGGNTYTKTFQKDTTYYANYAIDSLEGVVIDIDEFDWALPGNGIVIWHIDEAVIDANIDSNTINNNPDRLGVAVEEADGIVDIGIEYRTIFGDDAVGEGTDEDFWYASNPAELFENRFDEATRPNTNANNGSRSLIGFSDFSDLAGTMSFKVTFADSLVEYLAAGNFDSGSSFKDVTAVTSGFGTFTIFREGTSIRIYNDSTKTDTTFTNFSMFQPAAANLGNEVLMCGVYDTLLNLISYVNGQYIRQTFPLGTSGTTPPVIYYPQGMSEASVLIGTGEGTIISVHAPTDVIPFNPQLEAEWILKSGDMVNQIAVTQYVYGLLNSDPGNTDLSQQSFSVVNAGNSSVEMSGKGKAYQLALAELPGGKQTGMVVLSQTTTGSRFTIKDALAGDEYFEIKGADVREFTLSDLYGNGEAVILCVVEDEVRAYNLNGAPVDYFPFRDLKGSSFTGQPLTVDFAGDSKKEIVSVTNDGRIFAINPATGEAVDGFPIAAGGEFPVTPAFYDDGRDLGLVSISINGAYRMWKINTVNANLEWTGAFAGADNRSTILMQTYTPSATGFLPEDRAYNYPNPVYGSETAIRYYVSENADISIKIFDLAGDYVAELNDKAYGERDNETMWDVSGIQSGVYFARIEATSGNGKQENIIIKIAVVK